jgi:hypothetical protein
MKKDYDQQIKDLDKKISDIRSAWMDSPCMSKKKYMARIERLLEERIELMALKAEAG